MTFDYNYMAEEILEAVTGFSSLGSTLGLVAYVLTSLAIYTIAQRREIKKAWMAWVPVLNVWILGSISDQYRYVVKGQVKSKRKVLLGLNIALAVLVLAVVVMMFVTMFQAGSYVMQGYSDMTVGKAIMNGAVVCLIIALPVMILSLLAFIFEAIALYDLYNSCEPQNAVLYLVLSLIPGISRVAQPIFLFLCRNKDEGMPPRRPNPAPEFDEPVDYHYTAL